MLLLVALSACALVSACDKEKTSEPTAAPAATAAAAPAPTAPPPAATAGGAAPSAENIPVAADFEEEAEKSITKANYRAELDSLEAEIK
jgi:hypothetical protein